jgi:hypothetical protein
MAAQERTKQAQTKAEPSKPEPTDLLMIFDAPMPGGEEAPPIFDYSMLPPPPAPTVMEIPPSFDAFEGQMDFPAPPPIGAVAPPPPIDFLPPPSIDSLESPYGMAPSAPFFAPSAPSFEDLLESRAADHSYSGMQAVPPPAPPAIDDDVLGALDPAEREALLEEQRQIMEQIEKDKAGNMASGAAARALAFDQRSAPAVARAVGMMDRPVASSSARPAASSSSSSKGSKAQRTVDLGAGEQVPLHGQEKTKQAIKDGTAALVQCIGCQNWMQVTDNATLMFCPVCQTVSPVEKNGANASVSMEQAQQLDADQKLAEQLQQEEYKQAEGAPRARRPQQKKPEVVEEGQSWYDWLTGAPAPKVEETKPRSSPQRSPGLVSAQTGEERRTYEGGRGGGGARVAESKSMFACVGDAIGTAMTASMTDGEGNVHGVDSSSLLAMPQVSRQRD